MDVIGLESCFQPLGSNVSESGELAGLVQGKNAPGDCELELSGRLIACLVATGELAL